MEEMKLLAIIGSISILLLTWYMIGLAVHAFFQIRINHPFKLFILTGPLGILTALTIAALS